MEKPHNYIQGVNALIANGKLPGVTGKVSHVTVSHDDWCMVFSGGNCNCEPNITPGEPKLNRAQRRAQKGK